MGSRFSRSATLLFAVVWHQFIKPDLDSEGPLSDVAPAIISTVKFLEIVQMLTSLSDHLPLGGD
jgi:hypothetical protein